SLDLVDAVGEIDCKLRQLGRCAYTGTSFEIENWEQVSGAHEGAGRLDEMVGFVGAVVRYSIGVGRVLRDIHPTEVIWASGHAGIRRVSDVLNEVRIVVATRKRVVGCIARVVVSGRATARGADESEGPAIDRVDRIPIVLREVALVVGDVETSDSLRD